MDRAMVDGMGIRFSLLEDDLSAMHEATKVHIESCKHKAMQRWASWTEFKLMMDQAIEWYKENERVVYGCVSEREAMREAFKNIKIAVRRRQERVATDAKLVGIGELAEAKLFKVRTLYTKWATYWRDLPHVRKFYDACAAAGDGLEYAPGDDGGRGRGRSGRDRDDTEPEGMTRERVVGVTYHTVQAMVESCEIALNERIARMQRRFDKSLDSLREDLEGRVFHMRQEMLAADSQVLARLQPILDSMEHRLQVMGRQEHVPLARAPSRRSSSRGSSPGDVRARSRSRSKSRERGTGSEEDDEEGDEDDDVRSIAPSHAGSQAASEAQRVTAERGKFKRVTLRDLMRREVLNIAVFSRPVLAQHGGCWRPCAQWLCGHCRAANQWFGRCSGQCHTR